MSDRNDTPEPAQYEGMWSRLMCPYCDAYFYVEEDVTDGDEVQCEFCDRTSVVERCT